MDLNCRPAISSHSLGRAWVHDLPTKLAYAAEVGFEGVELYHEDLVYYACALFHRSNISQVTSIDRRMACKDVSSLCKRLGLHIVCLQPFRDLEGVKSPRMHTERIAEFRVWIDMAHILCTDLIAVASTILPHKQVSDDPACLAADFAEFADIGAAAQPPIRITYEALCFGTVVSSWEQAAAIVRSANRPNLGLCLDTCNIAGWAYADPAVPGGVRPDGKERLTASLAELVRTVDPAEVFYIQVSDAERLVAPLVKGHPLYKPDQSSRLSWSRGCRLFYGETNLGAYMPINEIMESIMVEFGWRGWVSMEMINRSLEEQHVTVPKEHAARGMASWERLVQDFPQLNVPLTPAAGVKGC